MTILPKQQYWEKLTEYFYDHIHWSSGKDKHPGMIEWLSQEYNAKASYYTNEIRFDDEKDATMFILRWSE